MIRTQVSSSNVMEVGYDLETATLEIMFKGDMVYQYFDVPESQYQNLINAGSVGEYLNDNIKGVFRYAKL